MTDFDPQLEKDLDNFRDAIQPSSALVGRIGRVTRKNTPFNGKHMWLGALAILVLVVVGVNKSKPATIKPVATTVNTVSMDIETGAIIDSIVDDALAEVADDNVALNSFSTIYD